MCGPFVAAPSSTLAKEVAEAEKTAASPLRSRSPKLRMLRPAALRHQDAGDGRHRARPRCRRALPALTILLMTGFADQRERAHGLEALVYDVVPSRSRCGR